MVRAIGKAGDVFGPVLGDHQNVVLAVAAGARLAGVAVGLNRQERGTGSLSAIQELEREYKIPVLSIIDMGHIIDYLEAAGDQMAVALRAMKEYRDSYGV